MGEAGEERERWGMERGKEIEGEGGREMAVVSKRSEGRRERGFDTVSRPAIKPPSTLLE